MEVSKGTGLVALIQLAVFVIANILVGLYRRWQNRKYDKASADYQRGVEEHQAKMRKESESDSSSSD